MVDREDHIGRGQLLAVVERDALAELEHPLGGVVAGLPALGELGHRLDLLVELDQAVAPLEAHHLHVPGRVGRGIEAVGGAGAVDAELEVAAALAGGAQPAGDGASQAGGQGEGAGPVEKAASSDGQTRRPRGHVVLVPH
jgi:hypothetical protein